MKTIVLTLSILCSSAIFANELSWVDKQVDAIKPARIGIHPSVISKLRDPFIFLEKNKTIKKDTTKKAPSKTVVKQNSIAIKKQKIKTVSRVLVLSAIMNNSVMISGDWYKLGDTVNGYKISEVNRNSVLLRKHKKKLLLSTKSNTKKLKFLNK
ncbi:hypothetical protein JHD47_09095 [Sulfurimonas sp. SAG-AH-194-L11]|nr:hypothetical protein [Sulfurimonas sp. SAG-AH-194-L11]MDF1877969.1 hypothetical protein [Sulfurimonas sp. SAG-AH-194-L11]